jgi:uncharacterized membrane protein HdeD (DUF308 family)
MDMPASAQSLSAQEMQARMATAQVARFWWGWLIAGFLWMAASVVILQFDRKSLTVVGVVIGIMFLVAGLEELVLAYMAQGGWRWFWGAFGVLLFAGGIWALFNPTQTFLAVANILGFVFILIGAGWTTRAIATKDVDPLWWMGLIGGILMLALGFWAAGQLLITQAYALLVFAGIWALLHGITDVVKAFQIRNLRDVAVR